MSCKLCSSNFTFFGELLKVWTAFEWKLVTWRRISEGNWKTVWMCRSNLFVIAISVWMDLILCNSAATLHHLTQPFFSYDSRILPFTCKLSLPSFSSSPPSFRLLPDRWAESSSDPSVHSHCLRKHGPIMAINNNGRAHLAWWLMGLSHSSFTWLLCGHQQLHSNVMLRKWAFHRILYDSRVEKRHKGGACCGLETGKERA